MYGSASSPNSTRDSVDHRIAEIAGAQRGLITTGQLLATGLSRGAIKGRAASGRFRHVHTGVYLVGAAPPTDEQRWMGGVLRVGEGAALRGLTAAVGRGFWKRSQPRRCELVCGRRTNIPELDVAYSRHWDASRDIAFVNDMPFTTAERMVIDLSGELTRYQLNNVIKEAAFWGAFDPATFELEARSLKGRAGLAIARRAVDSYLAGCAGTRSALEDRMVRLIEVLGFPLPDEAGYPIGPHEVDLVWADRGVIVEVDGPGHLRPNARKKDPARDADLRSVGFEVVRFTNRQIDGDPFSAARRLERCLG